MENSIQSSQRAAANSNALTTRTPARFDGQHRRVTAHDGPGTFGGTALVLCESLSLPVEAGNDPGKR